MEKDYSVISIKNNIHLNMYSSNLLKMFGNIWILL